VNQHFCFIANRHFRLNLVPSLTHAMSILGHALESIGLDGNHLGGNAT
jgi:hypothetical protein